MNPKKKLSVQEVEHLVDNPVHFTINEILILAKLLKRDPLELVGLIIKEFEQGQE